MKELVVSRISINNLSRSEITQTICNDFLKFTLQYDIEDNYFDFTLKNGTHVCINANGVITFNAEPNDSHTLAEHTKTIVISCGVHGNETAPIELCNKIVHKLLNEEFTTCHRLMLIFGNIDSMVQATRFVDENMNRLFSRDSYSTSYEGQRADELMNCVDEFFLHAGDVRLHYDLHTSIRPSINEKFAVYPYIKGQQYDKDQMSFLSACGVNTILLSSTPSYTFSHFSAFYHSSESFTVELGEVKPFGQNDMSKFRAIKQKLIELICDHKVALPNFSNCPLQLYKVKQTIVKQSEDFELHFDDKTANFTEFRKGDVLASQSGIEHCALQDREAIVFPNASVEVGHRAMLTVVPVTL